VLILIRLQALFTVPLIKRNQKSWTFLPKQQPQSGKQQAYRNEPFIAEVSVSMFPETAKKARFQ
jgi:hypothetical protein